MQLLDDVTKTRANNFHNQHNSFPIHVKVISSHLKNFSQDENEPKIRKKSCFIHHGEMNDMRSEKIGISCL